MTDQEVQMLSRQLKKLTEAINKKNNEQDRVHEDLARSLDGVKEQLNELKKNISTLVNVGKGFNALLVIMTPITKLIATVGVLWAVFKLLIWEAIKSTKI